MLVDFRGVFSFLALTARASAVVLSGWPGATDAKSYRSTIVSFAEKVSFCPLSGRDQVKTVGLLRGWRYKMIGLVEDIGRSAAAWKWSIS